MPATIDPTWDVPVVRLAIATTVITWAKVSVRAHNRRHGAGPTKVASRQSCTGKLDQPSRLHAGTVRMLHTLRTFAVAMAGSGEFDPLNG